MNPPDIKRPYLVFISLAVVALLVVSFFFPGLYRRSHGRTNLLLITIDTLRADKLGVYGSSISTPAIDSLAAGGIVFEKAYCQVPITLPSHTTILTGKYPYEHGIRHNGKFRLSPEALTLTEVLKSHGYHTAAFIGAYVLDGKYGLSQGFELYDDEMPGDTYPESDVYMNRTASEVTRRAIEWLKTAKEPFFMWVHYFDPHKPYNPPSPFREQYQEPYDGEVAYVDSELGRLLQVVSRMGIGRRTLVALTADHGESLGEHGELTHSIFLYDSTTRVPLILSLPGTVPSGLRDASLAQLVDLFPTLLSLLGIEAPSVCSGRNLLDSTRTSQEQGPSFAYAETWAPKLQYGWSELKSLRNEHYLYVRAPRPELYDLDLDPGELKNIHDRFPELDARFESELDSIGAIDAGGGMSETLELDAAEREALENLGYVFSSRSADSVAADPKDMIMVHRELLSGWKLLKSREYAQALKVLEAVRAKDEGDPTVYLGMGMCYDGLGEYEKSLPFFTRSIELDPLEERSYYAASNVLRRMERFEEAAHMLEALVAVYPEDPPARRSLAKALARAGNADGAAEAYQIAIELDRDDFRTYLDMGRFLAVRGRYEEAIPILRNAAELDPGCAPAYSMIGACYASIGDQQKAEENFRSSLDIDSTSTAVWVDLGRLLRNRGDIEGARNAYSRALSLDPGYEPAVKGLREIDATGGTG